MRGLICAFGLVIAAGAAEARVTLNIDASQVSAVLDAYERRDPDAADAIAVMRPTRELIAHHEPFSDQIRMEHYRDSLRAALSGEPRRDLWGFQRLTTSAPAIRAHIDTIVGDPAAFARDLEAIVGPYTPRDLDLAVDVGLVMGTPGAGWTDRPNEFFFDIGVPAGDIEGAKVVCAHELYHLVLARALPQPRLNFRLVDAMILAMAHTEAVSVEDVDTIAFGGTFTEPGYYVFREMAAGIETALGRERLVALLRERPTQFVLAYHQSAPADALRLHEETLALVRRLDARLARRR